MKYLLRAVLALLVVVILAVGGLLLFFDPNTFKPELVKLARDKGQVALTIDGEIGWSLFPNLALALPALTVDDLDGKRMASVEAAEVSVAVLPLLNQRLEMSGLSLRRLDLELTAPPAPVAAPASGAANKTEPAQPGGAPSAPPPAAPSGAAKATAPELDIGRIEIVDARIRYHQPAQGQTLELQGFNFEGSGIVSGRPFPATSTFVLRVLNANQQAELSVDASLTAQLLLDLAAQRYGAEGLDLKMSLGGSAFGGQSLPLFVGGDLLAELGEDRASVNELRLDMAGLQLRGQLQVAQLSSEPLLTGRLQAAPFDLNQLLQALGQPAVVTTDPKALTRVGFETELVGPANTLTLKPLRLQLDDSHFNGEVSVDLKSLRQRIRLQGDSFNLDRYLPPPTETAASKAGSGTVAENRTASAGVSGQSAAVGAVSGYSKEPLLPVEVLRGLNFDLQLGLKQLIASGLTLSDIELQANARDGMVRAERITGAFYGGRFDNSATIDARQSTLTTDVHKKITAIQLGGMLQDLAQVDRFSGLFSMEGRYQTRGNSIHAMVNSLTGNSVIGVKDGRLKGINLVDNLCQGIRQAKGLPDTGGQAPDYTDFSNLGATLQITNGVVASDDLSAAMVAVGLGGGGQVDLPQQVLDLGLNLTVLQQLQGERCQIEDKLHNLAFPVRCKGGFSDEPGKLCRPDTARMKQVIRELAKREVGDKLDQKLEQKLGDKLKGNEEVKSLIKGLFK